ncbi:MAG: class F sortase [Nocardioidaceae bacterium]
MELRQDLVELNVIGGSLQVPTDYSDVGWWRDGPAPGASGSAVLVGHVDSPTGPAVFYGLSSLQIRDVIDVRRADGTKETFRVSDVTLYPRESFPSASVYRQHGQPTLSLITCGGEYDTAAAQYTENLVVTAHPAKAKQRNS